MTYYNRYGPQPHDRVRHQRVANSFSAVSVNESGQESSEAPFLNAFQRVAQSPVDLASASAKPATRPGTLPVHEFWLAHKDVAQSELLWQRETMLAEITRTEGELLAAAEMQRLKADSELNFLRQESSSILRSMRDNEKRAWERVRQRELKIFNYQKEFSDAYALAAQRLVEREYEVAAQERALLERQWALEAWAKQLISERKAAAQCNLATARVAERDIALLSRLRARRLRICTADGAPFVIGRIIVEQPSIERYTPGVCFCIKGSISISLPRGTDLSLSTDDLIGLPITLTYFEGNGGVLNGKVVTFVEKDGIFSFTDIAFLSEETASSHILLLAAPQHHFGMFAPAEVLITTHAARLLPSLPHLSAFASSLPQRPFLAFMMRGTGNPDAMSINAELTFQDIEPFGLLGVEVTLSLRCICRGAALPAHNPRPSNDGDLVCSSRDEELDLIITSKAIGNDCNIFTFELNIARHLFEPRRWHDIMIPGGNPSTFYLQIQVPETRYCESFSHEWEIKWTDLTGAHPCFVYQAASEKEGSPKLLPPPLQVMDISPVGLDDREGPFEEIKIELQPKIYLLEKRSNEKDDNPHSSGDDSTQCKLEKIEHTQRPAPMAHGLEKE